MMPAGPKDLLPAKEGPALGKQGTAATVSPGHDAVLDLGSAVLMLKLKIFNL